MTNDTNFYSSWVAATNDTWFTTRSPHPELPCHIAPVPLPTCSNYSSYLPYNAPVQDVKDYLTAQIRILRFNNPEHTSHMVTSAICTRILYWMGNRVLLRDPYFLGDMLQTIIDECFSEDCTYFINSMDVTKYWYSDEIIGMSGIGKASSGRSKAKQAARQLILAEGYRDDLKVVSGEYRRDNFNVLPPLKTLTDSVKYSTNTVKKHGKDLYINQVDNIGQRVKRAKEGYPDPTQKEIAYLLGVSIRTIKEYWKSK